MKQILVEQITETFETTVKVLEKHENNFKTIFDLIGKLANNQAEIQKNIGTLISAMDDFKDQYDLDHPVDEGGYHE